MEKNTRPNMSHAIVKALLDAYKVGQEDEALEPLITTAPDGNSFGRMQNGDYVIFYDIRGEREIQITESLTKKDFDRFPLKPDTWLNFVTMIEYSSQLDVKVAFPPTGRIENTLAEVISRAGLGLCKISESEKAVHVAYFLNGKNEAPFPGEERIVVPSPENVDSYAQVPDMSAAGVTEQIRKKIKDDSCRLIIANLANVDVVGHIEDQSAVIRAVEAVDRELGAIVTLCQESDITLLVTADHGTVEEWLYSDGLVNTGHTSNPVPFIAADFSSTAPENLKCRSQGELSDIAPTILELLDLEKPQEMTGICLLDPVPVPRERSRKVLMLILDGWGIRQESKGNLIQEAQTPNFTKIWDRFPHAELQASGEAVGMPEDTVGNSESGHLHLGSGRRILLDRVRIDKSVNDGTFFKNPAFLWAMQKAKEENKALHLLGIVSFFSSHGTIKHLFALLELAAELGLKEVFVHALLGRRGEKPESGAIYVAKVEDKCRELAVGHIATVIGRHWALDREENWDRIAKTYRALVYGEGTQVPLADQSG